MSQNTLSLFNAVPLKEGYVGKPVIIQEYGVLITSGASYDWINILQHLKKNGVGVNELNSSFWPSWQKISQMPDLQMFLDQILHYFTTYGLEAFGVDSVKNGYVYIPNNQFNLPLPMILKVIDAVPLEEIQQRCFSLLNSGMALTQDVVKKIIETLVMDCRYEITGDEEIANKEAQTIFYSISGKLPTDGERLFRFLVYYFSGSSMVINDKKTRETIKSSMKILPSLDEERLVELSRSFNRHKELWMCIKQAHSRNRSVVNRLSKLSKVTHKPMPVNILNTLTSTFVPPSALKSALRKGSVFHLVRLYNALALRQANPSGSVYRIRNGKAWTTDVHKGGKENGREYMSLILDELRSRFAGKTLYAEEFVDYPVPTSGKNFVGNIPEGTVIRFPKSEKNLLVGIHWDSQGTDLDLRADSSTFSLGWNTNFRNAGRNLMHSGDMTRAPKPYGASEWLYFQELSGTFNVRINLYHGYDFDKKYKLILGASNVKTVPSGYIISPEEVLMSVEMNYPEDRQVELGMVYSEKDFNCFYIGSYSSGNGRIGRYTKLTGIQQEVASKKIQTSLRLADIFLFEESPEKASVDLSIGNLTQDSFLDIFNSK